MTATPSPWIPLGTTNRPLNSHYPIWVCAEGQTADDVVLLMTPAGGIPKGYTHWCEHVAPTPPPAAKPKTQRERDTAAFLSWWLSDPDVEPDGASGAWHAGIAYERAAIRDLITGREWNSWDVESPLLEEVLKRVSGGGKSQ